MTLSLIGHGRGCLLHRVIIKRKRELTDESKSVSSLFMNNEKMLPRRALTPQKPSHIRLFRASEIIPTRQIQIYGGVFEVVLQEKLSQIC